MKIEKTDLNTLWSSLIIEEFIRNGVELFCISPGSRSTPITSSAARNQNAETIVIYDERNSAYYALGYARATGKPAVVITTSGTASANCLPAVVEASMDGIPLIVLTADRPPELQSTGANQTIDQVNIFGKYVRWEYSMPCPDPNILPQNVLSVIDQLVFRSFNDHPGPVHLNCMFRESFPGNDYSAPEDHKNSIFRWYDNRKPLNTYNEYRKAPCENALKKAAEKLNTCPNGLVILGRLHPHLDRASIVKLVEKLNFPVFSDIASGMKHEFRDTRVNYYDQLLLSNRFRKESSPEIILHIGTGFTSKRLAQFLKYSSFTDYIQVCRSPGRIDPDNLVTEKFTCDISAFCELTLPYLRDTGKDTILNSLKVIDKECTNVINELLQKEKNITEPGIAYHVSRLMEEEQNLYLGNSMPLRDMDMFPDPNMVKLNVGVNRGTSGIDGNIASAAGFSQISGKPLTVILGDIAFLHNLNALEILNKIGKNITIIVINNNGGGIFSFLPVAKEKDIFRDFFTTPHSYRFTEAAKMFGIEYKNPKNMDEFIQAYTESLINDQPEIIEVVTDTDENYNFHELIKKEIIAKIDQKG